MLSTVRSGAVRSSAVSTVFRRSAFLTRAAATTNVNQDEGMKILTAQRAARPTSPHLTIYQPQITWYLSGANRITGVALSGSMYLFAIAYLTQPLHGYHIDSQTIATTFGSMPLAAKLGIKSFFAVPFSFHTWNGVRHLIWDMGPMLSNRAVQVSGYVVLGLAAVTSAGLVLV